MNARIDGAWRPEPEDDELWRRHLDLFAKGHPLKRLKSRLGAAYLRANRELLD